MFCISNSWYELLKDEFEKPYYKKLTEFLEKEYMSKTIYPKPELVFNSINHIKYNDVKVVIIGQDPYHEPNQAHGLSFSVQKGVPIPPSLLNIYKDLELSYPEFKRPSHGFLQSWSQQGVLLINACLTVQKGQADSHKNLGWNNFTNAAISALNRNSSGVIFLAFGNNAQKICSGIDKTKHRLLKTVHPSPLAQKGPVKFIGSGVFKKANELLLSDFGKSPINWCSICNA